MSKSFAVFDIDGTLIRWQLYHAVVDKLAKQGVLGEGIRDQLHQARMVWKRREHPEAFKEYEQVLVRLYQNAIKDLSTKDFDAMVQEVIHEYKDQTYVYTRKLLQDLKQEGYLLFIISGSHHELIEQLTKYYGFDDFVATTYERKKESFSGKHVFGAADKKRSLEALVIKHKATYTDSLAIGDSDSDIAMLELVEKPIAFNPDQTLFEHSKKHNWLIVVERKNVVYNLEPKDGTYLLAEANY